MKSEYRLYTYNERDGYDVNNVFQSSEIYIIDDSWTDEQLIKQLKKQGLIRKRIRKTSINIQRDFDERLYFDYKNKPEFELRKL